MDKPTKKRSTKKVVPEVASTEEKIIQLNTVDTTVEEPVKKKSTRKKPSTILVEKVETPTIDENTKNIYIGSEIEKNEEEIKKSILSEVVASKPKGRSGVKKGSKSGQINQNKKGDNEPDNIIVHLPIHSDPDSDEFKIETYKYDPNIAIPIGFESHNDEYQFIKSSDENTRNFLNSELVGAIHPPISSQCHYPFDSHSKSFIYNTEQEIDIYNSNKQQIDEFKTDDLEKVKNSRENDIHSILRNNKTNVEKCLTHMDECNRNNSWPSTTSVACWWCCHSFDNPPCAIPHEFRNGLYNVYGIFCSPECAAAYNFDDTRNCTDVWERYSLLNMLYRNVFADKHYKIKLAPPRQTLKMFGGNLTIKEFRANFQSITHSYKMILPPMISIIPVQELSSIDRGFTSKQDTRELASGFDIDDIASTNSTNNPSSTLRLKRSKPFVASNNTLNKCMQITIYKDKKDGSDEDDLIDDEELSYIDE
jgi:hypothetical protein